MENKNEISDRISRDLDMRVKTAPTDKEMLLHIADRVESMLKGDPDMLMSYLYRLDVEQVKIEAALKTSITPAHVTLANLIWERQKQRIETKKKYKVEPIEGWEF